MAVAGGALHTSGHGGSLWHSWFNENEFSEQAHAVFVAAHARAGGPSNVVGARHVAWVLFCEHPLGPRVAWATQTTDVRMLQSDLNRHTTSGGVAGDIQLADDDPESFLQSVRRQRPSVDPKGLEDIMLALFDPVFRLAPLFARNGLKLEDLKARLPRALKALNVYGGISSDMQVSRVTQDDEQILSSKGSLANKHSPKPSRPSKPSSPSTGVPQNPGIAAAKQALHTRDSQQRQAAQTKGDRSALAEVGVELVERARAGRLDPVVGRDEEISRALQILARRTKNNVCLIGAPGVGKTAVAEAIAQHIASGSVPPQLSKCKEVWALDIGALVAGTGLRGDFEERLRGVLNEIRDSDGEVLLFVDELHLLLGAGRSENNNVDAANLLKPMLARGELRCIGATTVDEYRRLILSKDAAFERRFGLIELSEPSVKAALQMLWSLVPRYAAYHAVTVSSAAVESAVLLSNKEIRGGRVLPDKAIDVLDEACVVAVGEARSRQVSGPSGDKQPSNEVVEVTVAHVRTVVDRWRKPAWPLARWLSGRFWSRL